MLSLLRALVCCAALALTLNADDDAPLVTSSEGSPVVIPRARQYDFTSKINGRDYRVYVSLPFKADPAKKYPIIYLLDGNWYFAPTAYSGIL